MRVSLQGKQAALKRHTEKLIMGPGQEADDVKAIQVSVTHAQSAYTQCDS